MTGDALLERLDRALAAGGSTHSAEHVMELVEQGHAQMLGGSDGLIVTEVVHYPNYPAVRVWLAAGEMSAVLKLQPDLERFAREVGARRLEGIGRMGWAKVMSARGWQPRGVLMVRELTQ